MWGGGLILASKPALFIVGAGLGIVAASCVTPGAYACRSDANCVSLGRLGTCEMTGYCAYPDPDCPSRRRYDDLAGDGLSHQCVDLVSTTGSDTSSTDSGSTGSTGEGPCPEPACSDRDADGYGLGPDCLGPDCDDDNSARFDGCLYLSPTGNDEAAGTRADPWLHFDAALPRLSPGDSLVLLDGEYTVDATGLPNIICGEGGNAVSGTPDAPISLRAENERQPLLQSDGGSALRISGCSHWRLTGLRGASADVPQSAGGEAACSLSLSTTTDIVARRLLFSRPNRYFDTDAYCVTGSERVTIEESAAYDFIHDGFLVRDSDEIVLRRTYANSRDFPDLRGCTTDPDPELPRCSSSDPGGDIGYSLPSNVTNSVLEQCISHGPNGTGLYIGPGLRDTLVRGFISIRDDRGILGAGNGNNEIAGVSISNTLLMQSRVVGLQLRSMGEVTIDHMTVVNALSGAVSADETSGQLCADLPNGCTVTGSAMLLLPSGGGGISTAGPGTWRFEASNIFGGNPDVWPGEAIDDDMGVVASSMSVAIPEIGSDVDQCLVFIPGSSAMKGAAPDGSDIGANILEVSGDPQLPASQRALWDPASGRFRCGAVVAGVNDPEAWPGQTCMDVHTHLHVQTNGCVLPADYGACDAGM